MSVFTFSGSLQNYDDSEMQADTFAAIVRPPWVKLSDVHECAALFFAYNHDFNHPTLMELTEACRSFGKEGLIHIVEAGQPLADFCFMQDQFMAGGSVVEGKWKPQVVQCCRKVKGELAGWSKNALGVPLTALAKKHDWQEPESLDMLLAGKDQNSVEWGGNILVSAPVMAATPAVAMSLSGPGIPEHPAAPFGKIIVGDAFHPEKKLAPLPAGNDGNTISPALREFLTRHRLQPVVPIDTSWLKVAHVDEIISFAVTKDQTPVMFIASPTPMRALLEALVALPCSHFHAGRWHCGIGGWSWEDYRETTCERLLRHSAYNERIQEQVLRPLRAALQKTLALEDHQVIELPVWFEPDDYIENPHKTKATAATVNVVNMVVLGSRLLIPRPHGPRVERKEAGKILSRVLGRELQWGRSLGLTYWARAGETLARVAAYFSGGDQVLMDARQQVIDSGRHDPLFDPLLNEIIEANPGLQLNPNSKFPDWTSLIVPLVPPDIVEWLVSELLAPYALDRYFVDDWPYHCNAGELHCGTNTVRQPPPEWLQMLPKAKPGDYPYDPTMAAPPEEAWVPAVRAMVEFDHEVGETKYRCSGRIRAIADGKATIGVLAVQTIPPGADTIDAETVFANRSAAVPLAQLRKG